MEERDGEKRKQSPTSLLGVCGIVIGTNCCGKGGGFKNDRMMVSILQTYTVCLPTVKKRFKDATATSTELIPSFYRT
jgi:hypothetical protein